MLRAMWRSGLAGGNAAQRLLEHLGRLAALDQVPAVDDDGRHRVDAGAAATAVHARTSAA
jgi:hypothetical protein